MYNKFIKKDGEVLLDLTDDSVSSSDLLEGVTAHDKSGEKITGTFTIDNELTAQDNLIAQIQAAVDSLPEAGGEPNLQTKTVTPTTSSQNVTPDSGYDGLSKVTINAIPSTYMKPSTIKFATTFTPTTSNQTIAAGTYCYGTQTIKGDANLVAENIAEGVSIFGVTGTHSGGGSGGTIAVTITGDSIKARTYYYWNENQTLTQCTGVGTFNALNGVMYSESYGPADIVNCIHSRTDHIYLIIGLNDNASFSLVDVGGQ